MTQATIGDYRVYFSAVPSLQYIFGILENPDGTKNTKANGRCAVFREGMFMTKDPLEIALLDEEIRQKAIPLIRSDATQFVTEDFGDPIKQAENKGRADLLKELVEKGVITIDHGFHHKPQEVFASSIKSTDQVPPELTGKQGALEVLRNKVAAVHVPAATK